MSMRNVLSVIAALIVTALVPVAGLAAHVNINIGIPVPAVPVPVVPVPAVPVPVAPVPVAPVPAAPVPVAPAPQEEAYPAEAPPQLTFAQPPDMAVVPSGEAAVYVIPNTFGVYFFNNAWYRFYNGIWFSAAVYSDPWVPVAVGLVPQVVIGVPPEYAVVLPPDYQRIRYGEFHRHWREWDRGHYWHNQPWFRSEREHFQDRMRHIERERERWNRGEGHRPPGFGRHDVRRPGVGPGAQPGHRPGVGPGAQPGHRPGKQPGAQPGRLPGAQTPKPQMPKVQAPKAQPHLNQGEHHKQ